MGEQVLVTGGAGFIGSHLVDALLERGHAVRVYDNLCSQVHGDEGTIPAHLSPDAEFIKGDVRDIDTLRRALTGVDVVFHKAAAVGVGQSMYQIREYTEVNTLGAANLLQILAEGGHRVRKVIVASSMSIYGEGAYRHPQGHLVLRPGLRPARQLAQHDWAMRDAGDGAALEPVPTPETKPLEPNSIYAINKRDHEEMVLCAGVAYGFSAVALRYFNVYGPRQALSNPYTGVMAIFSARYLNGRAPVIFEDGQQTRDFVHVSDVVQANLLAMERDTGPAAAFNVGTGVFTPVLTVAEELAKLLGFEEPPDIPGQFRAGDIRSCVADISLARERLGFVPCVSLAQGLKELVGWVQGQSAEDRVDEAVAELRRRGLAG
ncbi:MAG: NAD-dependent epimerase/dehydratase family protein [Candidatus Sumerlaeia bacterium]|nr:NAD-dependent epimerase/dehydratase family protein [Candidatus Sumerlaeia bacterium]